MKKLSSAFKGKQVGVIGFNARPIAQSLKRAGAETCVSDYWGDLDLKEVSDSCIAVLSSTPGIRQRQPLDKPLHQALLDNFQELTDGVDIDFIIIGSGFDDYSTSLKSIEKTGKLLGCSTTEMSAARDRRKIQKMTKSLELMVPKQMSASSTNQIDFDSMSFPCIVRKSVSGGGTGIRLAHNPEELVDLIKKIEIKDSSNRPIIQQYIRGKDVSCSILCTGTESKALSVQSQLIGMPTAGRNNDFVYCGNYWPSKLNSRTQKKIADISEKICSNLGLQGSVGIDYIVDDKEQLWFMEINPRIQGTLEMLENSGDISITTLHIQAISGELPKTIFRFRPSLKMIVFSRSDGIVPILSRYANVVDKSPPGVHVKYGDPICTVIQTEENITQCYTLASNIAIQIQREVKNKRDV